jgi:hypothetical protein
MFPLQLITERTQVDQQAVLIAEFLNRTEPQIRALKPRLPPPLRDQLAPLFQQLQASSSATSSGLGERMPTALAILSVIQKFDQIITVSEELKTAGDGTSHEVTTLYIGLSAAYFIGAQGDAGTSRAEGGGWIWKSQPELAAAISEAVAIAENKTAEAKFVPLPFVANP